MWKYVLTLFMLISIHSSSDGQDVKISTEFDSARIFVGDQIKYTITVEKPSGLQISMPVFKDTLIKNIEIIAGPHTDSLAVQNGRIKIVQKYLVTSFDSGHYQVLPVFAEIKNNSGLKRYYSDYSVLEVERIKITPPDTASKIFDIVKPYKAPVTIGEILPWLLALIVSGIVIWTIKRYLPLIKKAENILPVVPPEPAHIIAFRELELLKSEELWQKGEVKKYYTQLTEILRQYLENRFNVFSLELTTAETLDALVRTGFKRDEAYSILKSVLVGADLVKFAKYIPGDSENEFLFQASWNFVESTKMSATVNESINKEVIERKEVL